MPFVGRLCYSQEMPVEEYLACCEEVLSLKRQLRVNEGQWEEMPFSVGDSDCMGLQNAIFLACIYSITLPLGPGL